MNDYQLCLSKINANYDEQLTFIDVGCNINKIFGGKLDDFTELFLSLYPNSKGIGIEPLFWQQYENKWGKDSRITIIKKALFDGKEKFKNIYVPSIYSSNDHGLSSLYKRKIFSDKYQEIEIECVALDSVAANLKINYINYVKIDTEGSELSILKGSQNLLNDKKIFKLNMVEHMMMRNIPFLT